MYDYFQRLQLLTMLFGLLDRERQYRRTLCSSQKGLDNNWSWLHACREGVATRMVVLRNKEGVMKGNRKAYADVPKSSAELQNT